MKAVSTVTAAERTRGSRSGQVKENAGIGPFLQQRKTRYQNRDGSQGFPKSEDGHEVHRIAKHRHHAMGVGRILCDLHNPPASNKKRDEYGRYPIRNLL